MSTRNSSRWLRNSLSALLIWTLLAVPVLGALATMISQHFQSAELARESSDVIRQIEQKVEQTHGLLNSMVSVHVATSGNQSTLVTMAEKLRQDNPEITAVGAYRNVHISEREAFQVEMAKSGLYDFRIADLTNNERVASPPRKNAVPISLLEPMTPELLPLLGSDLAASSDLQTSLSLAMDQNISVETVIPDGWPAAGQLMMLQPVRNVPEGDHLGVQQDYGGYFLIVDPNVYLAGVLNGNLQSHINQLSLVLGKNGEENLLANRRFSNEHLEARGWFTASLNERTFRLGDTSLVLLIDSSRGLQRSHLVMAIIFIVLATGCFFSALLWLKERRNTPIEDEALRAERDRLMGDSHLSANPVRIAPGNRWLTLAVWVLLLVPALCAIAAMMSQRYQSEKFQHESFDVVRTVEQEDKSDKWSV